MQHLDTVVNFSVVDMPPTFVACESLLDKEKRTKCFGKEIQDHLSQGLQKTNFKVKQPVDEVIEITLRVNSKGEFSLKKIQASELVLEQLPELQKSIQNSVSILPKVFPATKRGIPVATEYVVPIRIKLVE